MKESIETIIPKGRTGDNLTIVEITRDGKTEKKYFSSVRCGLAWPTLENAAGYFCIVGQEITRMLTGEFPLMVLKESTERKNMIDLFSELFNQAGIFGAGQIYVDFSPKNREYVMHI